MSLTIQTIRAESRLLDWFKKEFQPRFKQVRTLTPATKDLVIITNGGIVEEGERWKSDKNPDEAVVNFISHVESFFENKNEILLVRMYPSIHGLPQKYSVSCRLGHKTSSD